MPAVMTPLIVVPGDPGWDDARQAWNLAWTSSPRPSSAPIAPKTSRDAIRSPASTGCGWPLRAPATTPPRSASRRTVLLPTERMRRHDRPGAPRMRGSRPARSGRTSPDAPPSTASRRWPAPRPTSAWSATPSAAASAGSAVATGCPPTTSRRSSCHRRRATGRADANTEPDLFRALRGGGGSFGVVTAIELRLYPVAEVYAGLLWWPVEAARRCCRPGAS